MTNGSVPLHWNAEDVPIGTMKAIFAACWLFAALAAFAVVGCDDERPVTGIDAANPADSGAEGGDAASD